jgi:hypothetical protein
MDLSLIALHPAAGGHSDVTLRPAARSTSYAVILSVVRLGRILSAQQLRCLVLRMCRRHLGFRHRVTSFAHQVLIDRQVIVSGGRACHSAGPSAVVLVTSDGALDEFP